MAIRELPGERRSAVTRVTILILLLLLLVGAGSLASYVIEIEWWKELGQLGTFFSMLWYSIAPIGGATLAAFAVLWLTHARALKFAGTGLGQHPIYARLTTFALLVVSWILAAGAIDTWTVVRYAGSLGASPAGTPWLDPVFGKPLAFYLFNLPFYEMLRGYVAALVVAAIVLYWIAARGWQLRYRLPQLRTGQEIDANILRLEGGLESRFLRIAAMVGLLILALRYFLQRYQMVYNEHGTFLVGIDYVDQNVALPLQWLVILAALAAAVLVWMGRWLLAASMALALVLAVAAPGVVSAVYVRPNELSLQRPYVATHIHATRSAYGLETSLKEIEFPARQDAPINVAANRPLLENARLWDWPPFHETITQIQALRPYYVFHDSDVERYTIDGRYRQVLLSPRELDLTQLPAARANWINPAFIYTHGYGMVLAPVSEVTPDGLPTLLIDDAPPRVKTPSLKLTRPEIYYGEVTHEPVFVHTAQQEFNYPSGESNVSSSYGGTGGFPVSGFGMRLAAAIREGEPNIVLTSYLTPNSRMMIRRRVRDRLNTLAGFLQWDSDPYLVITDAGRLVWIVDGYTTSDGHPYSRPLQLEDMGRINYIRNAVKATVDAYDGTTRMYVFAPDDPVISAYRNLFPALFRPESEMPADLRRHVRYPETLFRIQAEIYRTYHMLDAQAFYNKEDLWDVAKTSAQGNTPHPMDPMYLIATLPGETVPEFLLMIPFTPRNKDNLIGMMVARCDGDRLGQMQVLLLSKQELIFGPMQVGARINQDQNISKDLTLWNQQGSQVLRGQMLVLPVGNTFLYVDPIYIQATQAKMPQLKKVVVSAGNRLIYSDTYTEAIAQLAAGTGQVPVEAISPRLSSTPSPPGTPAMLNGMDARLAQVREHFRRYRELSAQGKWSEAGKELEAIDALVK